MTAVINPLVLSDVNKQAMDNEIVVVASDKDSRD